MAIYNKSQKCTLEEIKSLNNYFHQLINLIPPKVFFNKNEEMLQNIEIVKRKKFANSGLSAKSKHKRIKLDPTCQQKVSDIANEYCKQKKNDGKMNELRKKLAKRIKELRDARNSGKANKQSLQENKASGEQNENIPKILNTEGNLVFSKFDLATQVDLAAEKEIAKDKSRKKKPSLKRLLVKTKREDEKVAKLQETNSEMAMKLKEKKIWKTVLEKSEGNKVRDDPKLIEKALNRKRKMKLKKSKVWDERKARVDKQKQFKQEKRQKNLEERKQKRKEKKLKRIQKKRLIN